jgi:hypothetical protein
MKRLLIATTAAALMSMTAGYTTPASAGSPVFGNAKVAMLSTDAAKKVTAKGATTAYYLSLGQVYSGYAIQWSGIAQNYNWSGNNGPGGSTTSYALLAWQYSSAATTSFQNAYISSWYGG